MHTGDSADCSEPDFIRPAQVPRIATRVTWSEKEEPHEIAHRYGLSARCWRRASKQTAYRCFTTWRTTARTGS